MPKLNPKAFMTLVGTGEEEELYGYKAIRFDEIKWKQDRKGTITIDFSSVDAQKLNELDNAWVLRVINYQP